jgi:hypothetical protein
LGGGLSFASWQPRAFTHAQRHYLDAISKIMQLSTFPPFFPHQAGFENRIPNTAHGFLWQ